MFVTLITRRIEVSQMNEILASSTILLRTQENVINTLGLAQVAPRLMQKFFDC